MQHLVSSYGILAIFLLMTAESACIPIPSELIMTFAGALAATGKLSFAGAVVAGSLGNVVGSYVAWIVGRTGGRAAVIRFGRYVWLKEEDLHRAERWFATKGDRAVLIGRLLPVVRTFISLPAGIGEMPPTRFGVYTALGSVPFVLALTAIGYALGSNFNTAAKVVQYAGYLIAVIIVALVVAFYVRRSKQREAS
ncbi:MAG: DedA family protein [Acidimicrobiaceae bacterium]|nr:DedA family protein [Acidimicrobiaceae bacterium]